MSRSVTRPADSAVPFSQGFHFKEACDLRGERNFERTVLQVREHLNLEAFGIGLSDFGRPYLLVVGNGYAKSGEVALVPNCTEFGDPEHAMYVAPILPQFDIITIYPCRILLRLPNGNIPKQVSFFSSTSCLEIAQTHRFEILVGNGDYSFGFFPGPYASFYDARLSKHRITAKQASP